MDGKLKWSDPADRWTQNVFEFFTNENSKQSLPYIAMREHMQVDYIWRYDPAKYNVNDIGLALESESQDKHVDELIK
jgi:hypothetical protein